MFVQYFYECNPAAGHASKKRMDPGNESHYIQEMRQGNASSLRFLVGKYQDMVFTIALKISGNREDAEEIAQDVFLKCYQNIRSFRENSKFSTWLYRIAYNESISRIRRKKRIEIGLDEKVMANLPEEDVTLNHYDLDPADQKKALDMALEQLSEIDQLIVTLFYYDESSIEEIRQITLMSESNIKVRLHRIRKKLHSAMSEMLKTSINEIKY